MPNLISSRDVLGNIEPFFPQFVLKLRIHELFLAVMISSDAEIKNILAKNLVKICFENKSYHFYVKMSGEIDKTK